MYHVVPQATKGPPNVTTLQRQESSMNGLTVSTSRASCARTTGSTTDRALDGDGTESVAVAYDSNVIAHFRHG